VVHLVATGGLVAAGLMLERARVLTGALRLVRKGRAPALDRAREDQPIAIDASVDPEAPVTRAPLTGKTRAYWSVAVTRIFRSGKNWSSEPAPSVDGPLVVPLVGDGGKARVDLTHVAPDVRAVRRVAHPSALRKRYQDIVSAPVPESSYVLEERYLHRGERVHVIGRVVRFDELPDGTRVPVIGGTAAEPVILHAGSRRTLLRGIAVERGFLFAAAPLSLAVSLAALSLAVYVARIAP
jgi:hypothetical protein